MPTTNLITSKARPAEIRHGRLRELDARTTDGVTVRLLWDPLTDHVIVTVDNPHAGEGFTLLAETQDNPLDVFHHPYFYAALRSPGMR